MRQVQIVTYAATSPEDVPEPYRGMAKAVVNGALDIIVAHGATPEIAGAKLQTFYDEESAKLASKKPRGRKKRPMEAPLGAPPALHEIL